MKRFEVVDGGRKPDVPREQKAVVSCRRCGGAAFIEIRESLTTSRGRVTGGVKRLACARCMAEGVIETL